MEKNDENRWVAERLSALDPDWQADFARGKRLLDAGRGRQTRPWSWMAAAAVAGVCIAAGGPPQAVQDLEDAERKAGFRPYLPAPGVLPANPSMIVIGAMQVEQTIHVAELQA